MRFSSCFVALASVGAVHTKIVRRRALSSCGGIVLALGWRAPTARAADGVFPLVSEGSDKPNILTSRPLEWIRVRRQLEADERLGELADPNQSAAGSAARLAAVLRVERALRALRPLLGADAAAWREALAALANPPFEKKAFKRIFNAYSDNVYYEKNDADRALPRRH